MVQLPFPSLSTAENHFTARKVGIAATSFQCQCAAGMHVTRKRAAGRRTSALFPEILLIWQWWFCRGIYPLTPRVFFHTARKTRLSSITTLTHLLLPCSRNKTSSWNLPGPLPASAVIKEAYMRCTEHNRPSLNSHNEMLQAVGVGWVRATATLMWKNWKQNSH